MQLHHEARCEKGDSDMRSDELHLAVAALLTAQNEAEINKLIFHFPALRSESAVEELIDLAEGENRVEHRKRLLGLCKILLGKTKASIANAHPAFQQTDASFTVMELTFLSVGSRALRLIGIHRGVLRASLIGTAGVAAKLCPRGNEVEWSDLAVGYLESALTTITKNVDLYGWAYFKMELADLLSNRAHGDSDQNIERAITECEEVLTELPADHASELRAMASNVLGDSFRRRSRGDRVANLEKAIACFEAALRPVRREDDEESWATTLDNLAVAYFERLKGTRAENVELAIQYCTDALTVRAPDNHPIQWAQTQNTLGRAYMHRQQNDRAANLERAIECHSAALTVFTRDDAGVQVSWAYTQVQLGNVYAVRLRGDQAQNIELAIGCFEDALTILRFDQYPGEWLEATIGLATEYLARREGDREMNVTRAIELLESALACHIKERNPHHWAMINNALGNAYVEQGTLSGAERGIACYEAALTVLDRESDPYAWAETTLSLAAVTDLRLIKKGFDKCQLRSISLFGEVLQSSGQILAPDILIRVCLEKAQRTLLMEAARSISLFDEVEEISSEILAFDTLIRVCLEKARRTLFLTNIRWRGVKKDLQMAMSTFWRAQVEAVTYEARHELLGLGSIIGQYLAQVAIAFRQVDEALKSLEAIRGVGLRRALKADELLRKDLALAQRTGIQNARQRINNLRAEAALPAAARLPRPFVAIAAELREAEAVLDARLSEAGLDAMEILSIRDILATIPEGSALVVPGATEFGSYVIVVPAGTRVLTRKHIVELPELELFEVRDEVEKFTNATTTMKAIMQNSIDQSNRKDLDEALMGFKAVLSWLGEEVMGPVLSRLSSISHRKWRWRTTSHIRRLFVMPIGVFGLLPFHAAIVEQEGLTRYVLENYTVSYTPSIHALRTAQARGQRLSKASVAALVDPTSDLTFAGDLELHALYEHFGWSRDNNIVVGERASKHTLKRIASGCSYLHLACHGRFDRRHPHESGLRLSGNETLTIPEIVADLDLRNCRLALLSACETGVVDVENAPDEAIGQVAAFQEAGARCVAASLWAVEDISTSLLVGEFYRQHLKQGLRPAEAMRASALWLRGLSSGTLREVLASAKCRLRGFAQLSDELQGISPIETQLNAAVKPFESPFYWAPFGVWGV
jgi:tetratricopeptide (TPR) repeat protein